MLKPKTPAISLPTDADLKPLYDAAQAYGTASVVSFDHWYAVKMKNGGDENSSKAAQIAYADPESKRLTAIKDRKYKKMSAVRDTFNEKFPHVKLDNPAPWVSQQGKLDSYKNYVRSIFRTYVERQWREINQAEVDAMREQIRTLRPINTLKPQMFAYTRTYGVIQVAKITHNGKRIVSRKIDDDKQVVLSPTDKFKRVSRQMAEAIIRYSKSCENAVKSHGLSYAD